MVSQTLFLTAGMPHQVVLDHLQKVQENRCVNAIHIVDFDLGRDEDIAEHLLQLLHFDDRPWHTIKLAQCRGKSVHRLVEAIASSNVRRLIISPTPNTARSCLTSLASSLTLSSTSLLTLSIQDVRLNYTLLDLLTTGLVTNTSIVDLSFTNCRFSEDDSSHLLLGNALQAMGDLQHLSLSNCRLEDAQCHDIVLSLMGNNNSPDRGGQQQGGGGKRGLALMELNLDGNRCQMLGLKALSMYLPESSLLVLDLSNQKISSGSMDLSRLTPGLAQSRVRSLQLSGNVLNSVSFEALTNVLTESQVLKIVHLAWVPLDERAMLMLANSMRRNTSISKLVLHGCGIDNQGLARFSNRIRQMKGIRQLDLGGFQQFDSVGLHSLATAVQRNTEIDRVILPATSKDSVYMDQAHLVGLMCDANRAGRRFLREQGRAPISLWPLILNQVQNMELPNLLDGIELPSILPAAPITDDDDDMMSIDGDGDCMDVCRHDDVDNKPTMDPGIMRRASVLYLLLRNGPLLHL
jgi:hypothetical protein